MFCPYPHLVEEATYFPFFTLWYGSNYIELYSHMPLQGPKFYIPLYSDCCLIVAYCYDFQNR